MMDDLRVGESVQIKWLSRRLELEVARRPDAEASLASVSECSDIEYIREQFTLAVADWSKQQRVSENRITAAERSVEARSFVPKATAQSFSDCPQRHESDGVQDESTLLEAEIRK